MLKQTQNQRLIKRDARVCRTTSEARCAEPYETCLRVSRIINLRSETPGARAYAFYLDAEPRIAH